MVDSRALRPIEAHCHSVQQSCRHDGPSRPDALTMGNYRALYPVETHGHFTKQLDRYDEFPVRRVQLFLNRVRCRNLGYWRSLISPLIVRLSTFLEPMATKTRLDRSRYKSIREFHRLRSSNGPTQPPGIEGETNPRLFEVSRDVDFMIIMAVVCGITHTGLA